MKRILTLFVVILVGISAAFSQATITKSGYITSNETWTKNNIYRLSGFVYIDSLATVTIEPGTLIYGEKSTKGSLIVTRGGKLIADGNACEPIVFTSEQAIGARTYGDWGGIILLGRATINQAGGTAIIEGGVDDGEGNATYGGGVSPDDNDNSGILRYVRIEFPGIAFQPNNEINGLTMGGVGRGTTIDYVQVSFSGDDAFEWFGGTVNCSHLIAHRSLDDNFDADNGFSGNVQFAVSHVDPNIADISGSNGFEIDNDATGSSATPKTNANFSNISVFGPLETTTTTINANYKRGAHLRRNNTVDIYNTIIAGYPDGVFVDATTTQDNWCSGLLNFDNNVVSGWTLTSTTPASGGTGACFTDAGFLATSTTYAGNASLNIADPFDLTSPDFMPNVGSPVLTGADFSWTSDPFFQVVLHRGAFGLVDWTKPWANFDPSNTVYSGATNLKPTVSSAVVTNETCPLTGAVNVTVSGGVQPYTYQWSNGATTEDISSVAAAFYTVTVTAVGGCTAAKTSEVKKKNIPKPTGLAITNNLPCELTLTWSAQPLASKYKLRKRVTGTTTWTNISGFVTGTSYTFTGLTPGTSYDLSVKLICASDDVTSSGFAQKTGATTTTCGQPSNLSASAITQTSATISWTGQCNAVTYDVQYRKTGTVTWTLVNTASTSTNITGLTANTSYDYRIRTKCAGSNSAYTAIQTFMTTLRLQDENDLLVNGIQIFPNPADNLVTVQLSSNDSRLVNIRLVNVMGSTVAEYNNVNVNGTTQVEMNLSAVPNGNYFVNIYDGAQVLSHRLVVNK